MSTYLITKRDKCLHWLATVKPDGAIVGICPDCNGTNYIDTPVDLLEVLAKVRWGEDMESFPNNEYGKVQRVRQFDNVRIEE